MSKNAKDLPLLEIILLTGGARDDIASKDLPTLTVVYDGQQYLVVGGVDTIKSALVECFQNLDTEFYTALVLAVDLQRIETEAS